MFAPFPFQLMITMGERIGFLISLAFLATRSNRFRQLVRGRARLRDQVLLAAIFGLFGIVGTYSGVVVSPRGPGAASLLLGPISKEDAIANSRAVSIIVAGLIGGPWIGLGAGLIAGVHRYFVGGFTALACMLSTTVEGVVSGLLRRRFMGNASRSSFTVSFLITVALEGVQMLLILAIARPFAASLGLVQLIALPMMLANGAGVALFMVIVQGVMAAEAAREGGAAREALLIATRMLPYLRKGLNAESAAASATIIKEVTGATAVAVTDTETILAHVGAGADHHRPGAPIRTHATLHALEGDQILVAEGRSEIECEEESCPLQGAVVVPLHENRTVVGTLKLYFDPTHTRAPLELAEGLAYHFSTQLALARAEERATLLAKAEIRALQAQIQPHFLFNALNTIMALIRLDPEKARDVLGHLGDFIRRNLQATQCETITLAEELEHIRDYLTVEEARYGDKLSVTYVVEPGVEATRIPALTLQPLVENAIVHGLRPVRHRGLIQISAAAEGQRVVIRVADNGQGIAPERLSRLLERPVASQTGSGLALHNVHQRLRSLFGEESGLAIASTVGQGTTVTLRLPAPAAGEEVCDVDSHPGGR